MSELARKTIDKLDVIARNADPYEYGLPIYHEDAMADMIQEISQTQRITVSVTHLKNIIALAEENAMKNPDLSPLVEIELVEKATVGMGEPDLIKIMQLPYSFNKSKAQLIGR